MNVSHCNSWGIKLLFPQGRFEEEDISIKKVIQTAEVKLKISFRGEDKGVFY